MENKINIAELLKDTPKGTELYSPLCGRCVFDRLNMGTIICKKQNTQEITFTSEGYYMIPVFDNCECMLFPSKDQRDWRKFQRPFKDGDIIYNRLQKKICIYYLNGDGAPRIKGCRYNESNIQVQFEKLEHPIPIAIQDYRLATEEEKEKLFQAIKANGYKWNPETKTLEKLIEPKFNNSEKVDNVNHPPHYTWLKEKCGIEVIDITRHLDFDCGNVVKYTLRHGHKDEEGMTNLEKAIEDLKKAKWYLEDKIKMLEEKI